MREISPSGQGSIIMVVVYAFVFAETVAAAVAGHIPLLVVCLIELSLISSIGGILVWDEVARLFRRRARQ